MFKSLRDRLKGVSKKIEDEMDFELEQRLDAELEASMQDTAPSEPEGPREPVVAPQAPAEGPVPSEGDPVAATSIDADEAPAADVEEAAAGDRAPAEPEEPEPGLDAPPEAPPEDRPAQERPPVPEEPKEAAAPVAPRQKGTDAPRYGRKILTEQEIEARLQRELEAAVETQKDVETVVQASSGKVVARYSINEDVLEEILWELEVGLLESDVALPVIEAIKESVKEQLLSMTVGGKDPHDVVEKVLRSAVRRVLNVNPMDFDAFVRERLDAGKRPVVVMFVGVNGTGKTTSIGRIAYRLKQNGISCVMAAGDTFRAGAIEQLSQHGDRLGIKVVKHTAGADSAAVAYDAVEHAKARRKDVVLLDTAGRMQTNTNLMDEMDKIRRVAKPDMVVFVGDSLAGNDAVEQARRFDEVVDIDAAILTKVDVDAKGGAALSVAYTINKPLMFVGVGQDYPDLRPFDAGWMVDRLFGDEDVATATDAS